MTSFAETTVRTLKGNAEEIVSAPPDPSSSVQPSAPSIDDIAALLVQLDPTDNAGLTDLQTALTGMSAAASTPAAARHSLGEAIRKIETLLTGAIDDASARLAEVGRLIENVATIIETGDAPATVSMETSAPAHSPEVYLLPADADKDLVSGFITESREYILAAESALLIMETDPDDAEAVNVVFRGFHTIKGASSFLGITLISELAHHAETLLSRVREKEIRCTGGYADLALRSADTLKELLQDVQDALGGKPMTKPAGYDGLMSVLANPEAAGISIDSENEIFPPSRLGDILVANRQATREDVETAAAVQANMKFGEAALRSGIATGLNVAKAMRAQQRLADAGHAAPGVDSLVRVSTDRLDRLINLVGELVIAQSLVAQDETVVDGNHHDLARKVGHAGKIVRELQDLSMSMRMVPLKATFQKMARLVRDLAHKSGKLVNLITEGEDTEIDRNMVDVLSDPLVHMIRNSCDHGIEPPEMREQNGKSRTGTIRLSAYHSGSNVVVELQDDGRGLNREKILKKAIERGLIDSDKSISDSEIYNQIFEPGFSTADKITDVSGRGVGMDVVRRNIEALHGRIEIDSEFGRGSTFTMRLPLTLAITDGMLVKVGDERYLIPNVNINLSFRPERKVVSTVAGRGEMVMLRNELMPMFRIHRLFEVDGAVEDPTAGLVVVVDDGDRRCALLVDELLGQHQVVAKSLGDAIGRVPGISGGAILGNGRVGLILDPAGIVALARESHSNE